jgi:hypothetical protein
MKKLLDIGINISKAIKIIIAVITFTSAVLLGIKGYNKSIINRHDKAVQDSLLMIDMRTAIVKIDSLSVKVDRIAESQDRTNRKLGDVSGTVTIVKDQLVNHVVKTTNDKQDIINILNAFEKKNVNGTSMIPYVLR